MNNKGREISLYGFIDLKGIVGYYQTNGKVLKNNETPINGARLSSTF